MKPIVDAATMRLLEEKAFSGKETVESLMDIVGEKLAEFVSHIVEDSSKAPAILLIAGKGNNGADGYTALMHLMKKGCNVAAWQVSAPPLGSLLEKRKQRYMEKGGRVVTFPDIPSVEQPLLILDGMYGAGFKGQPDEASSKAILWANAQGGLIISIDLPSGIDPNTGEVPGEAIYADYTFACHLPKRGCFLGRGWEYSGIIHVASLPVEVPKADLCLMEEEDVLHLLPRKRRTVHKFQSGSVTAIAGSLGMMGAASLACEATYSVGAGYVRILMSKEMQQQENILPREVVKAYSYGQEVFSSDSILVGPGMGRDTQAVSLLENFWPQFHGPTVVDADALFWLAQQNEWDVKGKVLTPHLGEASRLFKKEIRHVDEALLQDLRVCVATKECTIVLKGAPTYIISPNTPTLIMPRGDPGMATAGAGDVLSGMLAGLLAQKMSLSDACMLATWLHGVSGEIAASRKTSYATVASSIIQAIPAAISILLEKAAHGAFRHYAPFGRVESQL